MEKETLEAIVRRIETWKSNAERNGVRYYGSLSGEYAAAQHDAFKDVLDLLRPLL